MQAYPTPEYGVWVQMVLVLAVGAAVIVALAALAGRMGCSALWRRTIWQVAMLGLLALMVVELTGTGSALVGLWRPKIEMATIETRTIPTVDRESARRVDEEELAAHPVVTHGSSGLALTVQRQHGRSGLVLTPKRQHGRSGLALTPNRQHGRSGLALAAEPQLTAKPQVMAKPQFVGASPKLRAAEFAQPDAAPTAEVAEIRPGKSESAWWPGLIWALGMALVTSRIAHARGLLFAFRRRQAIVRDEVLRRRVAELARRLGIRRPVDVLQAAGLRIPVAFGSIRPTIALPGSFAEEFDRRQQEAILAHELAHLAAGDAAWQLLADLLCAVLWWHPLVWWSRRRLRMASEAAADEASLLVPDGPHVLADCLVAMGRQLTSPGQLGWLSIGGPVFRSNLGRRVERLLSLPRRSWRAPRRGRLAAAKTALPVSLVCVAVLCTAWVRPRAIPAEGGTTMNVLSNSWRRSLAALAVAAFLSAASGDAVADDSPTGEPSPAIARDDLPDEGLLVLQGADEDRDEAEARDGEQREREEGEEHERREVEDRERHEVEEADRHEVEERERHEVEERERRVVEEREGDEPERVVHELMQEQNELEERAAAIRRELEQLGDGQDDEARELHAAMREIQERMQQIQRELGGQRERRDRPEREGHRRARHVEELRHEFGELEEKAQHIKRELGDRGPDADDEAHELHAVLREVHGRMEDIRRELHGGDRARPRGEREHLAGRLEELKRAIGELMEAGRHDEANRLEREAHEIMQRLRERAGPDRPRPDRPGPPDDLQRRIEHMKVAIDNLHAAGLHEAAEELTREVDHLIAEHRERFGDRPMPPGHPEGPPHPPHGDRPPHPEGPERVIHELQDQVNQLRREMEEMRGLLEELVERQRERR